VQLHRSGIDGSDPKHLKTLFGQMSSYIAVSHDGTRLAYTTGRTVREMDIDGSGDHSLFTMPDAGYFSAVSYSPDGRTLAFVDYSRDSVPAQSRLKFFDFTSGRITAPFGSRHFGEGYRVTWHPDGDLIAVSTGVMTTSQDEAVNSKVLLVTPSGDVNAEIPRAMTPFFSRDGRTLYFFREGDGLFSYDMSSRNIQPTALLTGPLSRIASNPIISPDGRKILFSATPQNEPHRIHIFDIASGKLTLLPGQASEPPIGTNRYPSMAGSP
jgi:Tol biopolymer transport system component